MGFIIIAMALSWLLQSVLGFLQIRHFNRHYTELRRIGRVAIGKKAGRFRAGTVVMLAIDSQGKILKAARIQGVTVFSRVRSLKGLEGKPLPKLEEGDLAGFDKLTKGAIRDAISSYKIISNGGELKLKKTWIERLIPAKK
ncbi:transcriptional regulator GutM [Paenibacillus durus]|uniref:Glucitol operon activator n=1 Tax=Paenibacillus durus ATCC 35681 TaxID=1333534 RepID=A0A0F7CGN0_PAEDU|nr:transcriptional regulator GutM [Paenibacillus durus]AKG33661.1 glucitol operon activator [Paenibacillus durus ATCC 35681]